MGYAEDVSVIRNVSPNRNECHVCLICVSYMCPLYVCRICVSYMCALYVCLISELYNSWGDASKPHKLTSISQRWIWVVFVYMLILFSFLGRLLQRRTPFVQVFKHPNSVSPPAEKDRTLQNLHFCFICMTVCRGLLRVCKWQVIVSTTRRQQ
jgi:hypothetical protein